MTQPLMDMGGGSLFDAAEDANSILAKALVTAGVPLSAEATREALFIITYLGSEGEQIVQRALELKRHATGGLVRNLVKAAQSFALWDKLRDLNLNAGGGK